MAKKITIAKVNGVGAVKETAADGTEYYTIPRFVMERNVLDMLEGNEDYMNLDFSDAQIITEEATMAELFKIYTGEMTANQFRKVYERILG